MPTWSEICADPSLEDLPYKIESNRWGQIVMSPAFFAHSDFQIQLVDLLKKWAPPGRVMVECPIQTSDGVRAADVAWMSRQMYRQHKKTDVMSVAPEVCVEVISKSNSREQMREKAALYFEAGAKEVWLCGSSGVMEFFVGSFDHPATSIVCPQFPLQVILDDDEEQSE